jgi:hypothetical protein
MDASALAREPAAEEAGTKELAIARLLGALPHLPPLALKPPHPLLLPL